MQYTGHVYHVTTIPQCYWRKLLWRHTRLYRLYIPFGIVLTQFYINFSRQEHQIDVLYISFKTWDSQVSVYTPFHFSFTVPLKQLHIWKFVIWEVSRVNSCKVSILLKTFYSDLIILIYQLKILLKQFIDLDTLEFIESITAEQTRQIYNNNKF